MVQKTLKPLSPSFGVPLQQNLIFDSDNGPVDYPDLEQIFSRSQKENTD